MRRPIHLGPNQPALESGRLNRFIARAGVCSRRKADQLIADGRVRVNGSLAKEFWLQVGQKDQITVDGKLISLGPCMYVLLNKPTDTITSSRDERGRSTVMDLVVLPEGRPGLFNVGRLDRNTTGVLLMTSDGELGHRLMHPSYRIPKRYAVRTKEPVQHQELHQLRKGIMLDDGLAKADQVTFVRSENRFEIGIEIHEGRNRQIRRMFRAINHEVAALERVSYAGLTTRGVKRGRWRYLKTDEVNRLRRLVGIHRKSSKSASND